jgi:hypothetical protein
MHWIDSTFVSILEVLAILVLAFVIRNLQGYFDRKRIQEYVEGRGGKIIDIAYRRFGPGWLGSNERLYQVSYRDRDGRDATGICKTREFSGVYWTDDSQ